MEAAVDWLRKKGLSKAAKKAGRVAAEGLIGVTVAGTQGRRGRGQFRDRLRRAQRSVPGPGQDDRRRRARAGADVEKIKAAKAGSITVAEAITDTIAKIGENMTLRRAAALSVEQGRGRQLRAQLGDRRARQDRRAGRARIGRQGRRARRARPAGRDARRRGQSAGGRSVRARSGGGRAREGRAGREIPRAGQARQRDRQDRRVRA